MNVTRHPHRSGEGFVLWQGGEPVGEVERSASGWLARSRAGEVVGVRDTEDQAEALLKGHS